ncbi:hypothetical protein SNE40_007973 [Patella caerulea]|uniref:gamma-glutamylcyclotransferase n=1 Tax=Patella caerulea TaxID=87958 RepID=A0AAN8K0Y6_PATCE
MSKEKFYHFGYASNMLKERLLVDRPNAYKKFVCVAKLQGYKLTFDRIWPLPGDWHGPCATIRPDPEGVTWGVVWELETGDKAALKNQECKLNDIDVIVEDQIGNKYTCLVFEMGGSDHPGERPSPQYKDIIIRGARQSGIPNDYITVLESIEDSGYDGPHALYSQVLESLGIHQQ